MNYNTIKNNSTYAMRDQNSSSMFEEFDGDMYDDCNKSPSGSKPSETFDEMIKRKVDDNFRKLFGHDG